MKNTLLGLAGALLIFTSCPPPTGSGGGGGAPAKTPSRSIDGVEGTDYSGAVSVNDDVNDDVYPMDTPSADITNVKIDNDSEYLYILTTFGQTGWYPTDIVMISTSATDGVSEINGTDTNWPGVPDPDFNVTYDTETFEFVLWTNTWWDGSARQYNLGYWTPSANGFGTPSTSVPNSTTIIGSFVGWSNDAGAVREIAIDLADLGVTTGDSIDVVVLAKAGDDTVMDSAFDGEIADTSIDQEHSYQAYTIQ
jgi:hypothetical protein